MPVTHEGFKHTIDIKMLTVLIGSRVDCEGERIKKGEDPRFLMPSLTSPSRLTLRYNLRGTKHLNGIEGFSIECRKTKTKPITYQLDFSANLKL